jgi:hypothetical protein
LSCLIGLSVGCDSRKSNTIVAEQQDAKNENSVDDVGEIKSCSPSKLYRGDVLTVSLKTPHGRYAAIRRMNGSKWFFLYGENSEPI